LYWLTLIVFGMLVRILENDVFKMRGRVSKLQIKRFSASERVNSRQENPICRESNPYALDFAHADVVIAPIIEAGGLGVRVTGHALRFRACRRCLSNP
jgi:hypothetical protein